MDKKNMTPFWIQGILIAFYFILSIMFAMKRNTMPLSFYYFGCVIKDAGVLLLGLMISKKE